MFLPLFMRREEYAMALCEPCEEKRRRFPIQTALMGTCISRKCVGDGTTGWSGDKYCEPCSDAYGRCEHCGAAMGKTLSLWTTMAVLLGLLIILLVAVLMSITR